MKLYVERDGSLVEIPNVSWCVLIASESRKSEDSEMGCSAKIRPFPNDTELQCELEDESHETHESVLRNYAYPGSETRMTWLDSDRRTFRGNWVPCPWDEGCILPLLHKGDHAP